MWSVQSLAEAVKSILKLLIVAAMAYLAAQNIIGHLADLMTTEIQGLPKVVGGMVAQLGLEISGAFVVLAALDYLFQRYEFERSIRMSREEIKEEMKRQEGDPQIKSQIRQRGRALALRRMMQEVPKADVVITNPTHFAVAIRYDAASMSAPKVVAKGQDELAWRIRKLAEQSGVPRVENRQLAQTLYRTVELDQLIPSELYQAVAEVLAYVYRLRQGGDKGETIRSHRDDRRAWHHCDAGDPDTADAVGCAACHQPVYFHDRAHGCDEQYRAAAIFGVSIAAADHDIVSTGVKRIFDPFDFVQGASG
ncbi:hypothetical protein GCM10025857_03780 [Alicyclobacillus contaminans]|nr:hypothetical protein GCM10025857_03780 [Alicyclobacillus contaminans]